MSYIVSNGPFKGTEVPAERLELLTNQDGSLTEWWPVHARTPIFLDRFAPEKGWSIEVVASPGPFNLPDYRNQVATNAPEAVIQPTQLFTASLKLNGAIVNQASSLEVIDGPKAWERGETNARGRLYEAMGLSGNCRTLAGSTEGTQAPVVEISPVITASSEDTATAPVEVSASEPVPAAIPVTPDFLPTASAPSSTGPRQAVTSGAIDGNLIQQINTIAKIKGLTVPSFASLQEAKDFMKDLLMNKVSS